MTESTAPNGGIAKCMNEPPIEPGHDAAPEIEIRKNAVREEPSPPKKKVRRYKKKTSDRGEYVKMSKKEKEAEAREKRQYFDYLEAEELQEYQYMAIIKEQLLKEAHPDVALTKPAKRAQKKKASRTKAAPRSKTKKKRPRIDNGSSDWEDGDHFRVDDSDDVVVVNVVPSQPKSAFPICINDDEDAMSSKRTRKQRPQQAQTQTSVATTVSEQLQRPTQFRVGVVKKSYHHSHKISFELTEEEYSVLLNNVSLPKCPGVAGILKGQFPPAPSESLCPTCHSMMFLYHCQQSIINPPTT